MLYQPRTQRHQRTRLDSYELVNSPQLALVLTFETPGDVGA